MALQLRLFPCSPTPPYTLSSSQTLPSLRLPTGSALPSRIPSFSLPSLQPSIHSLIRLPIFSASAVAVSINGENTSVKLELESESEDVIRTKLLAQNVPWNSTADDIRALFEKHGTVVEVELSMQNKTRNRGLAFVEMGSPEEAKKALTELEAYEFEGRTLKLNYARPRTKKPSPIQPKKPLAYELFVSNLSYEVTSDDLREFFSSEGFNVVSAGVVLQGNPRRSAGYGFVSFSVKWESDAALSTCQGKVLLGRDLDLARSKRFVKVVRESKSKPKDSSSGTILDEDEDYKES